MPVRFLSLNRGTFEFVPKIAAAVGLVNLVPISVSISDVLIQGCEGDTDAVEISSA